MNIFRRSFRVSAPLDQVAKFHQDTRALRLLTPPPVIVQFHRLEPMGNDSIADFTLWVGPLPVRWVARHLQVNMPAGFVDTQERGPFDAWVHRHTFKALSESTTLVTDEVMAQPGKHPFWGLVSRMMWLQLPLMFAYRAWQTRRGLEKK